MLDNKTSNTLDQADKLYQSASEEYSRPEEDVVPYMVCRSAYKAVDKYLTAFLMKHGIEIHNSMSIDVLLELCRDLDTRFNDLTLDPLLTKSDNEDLWMNMDTVNDFYRLASETRKLVAEN